MLSQSHSSLNKTAYKTLELRELPCNQFSPVFGWAVPNVDAEPNTFCLAFSGSGCRPSPPNPPNMPPPPPLPFKTKITEVRIEIQCKGERKGNGKSSNNWTALEKKPNLMHISSEKYWMPQHEEALYKCLQWMNEWTWSMSHGWYSWHLHLAKPSIMAYRGRPMI